MKLEELYEMQKTLDARIIAEKELEGQDLLPNTVLALQVEIAELADEWRGFKHWSNFRDPRRGAMLEEYVDCLHFFLSTARQLDLPASDLYFSETDELEGETALIFTELLHCVGQIGLQRDRDTRRIFFRLALSTFFGLGEERLGFAWGQIAEAYVEKNRTNHERQANGF